MKKFLALVLALVMTMSLVTISAGAEDFTDAEAITYEEAVDVMTVIGVVGGYADGSFNPTAGLTRGAAAKIICNMILGPTTAEALSANDAPFSDVAADNVFAGYIAYCVNEGIISGYADGTFKPAAPLTGYAFMKMLLGALGYDAATEGYVGTNWSIAVAKRALNIELDKGLVGDFSGAKALTREEACLYAFNTLKAEMVDYDVNSSITVGDIVISNSSKAEGQGVSFMKQYFKKLELGTKASDKIDLLDRPATTWYYDKDKVGTYAAEADYVIVNEFTADEWADLLEELGIKADKMAGLTAADTANGRTIELFYNDDEDAVASYAVIEADLVEVSAIDKDKVSTTKKDERALQFASSANLWVAADTDVVKKNDKAVEIENFEAVYEAAVAADDENEVLEVLVITDVNGKVFSVEIPEIVSAKVTRVKGDVATAGGEAYVLAGVKGAYTACVVGNDELTVGANGCVYKAVTATSTSDVVYLDSYLKTTTDKYGEPTYTALVVNEEFEIVEWVVDVDTYAAGYYTYDINDDDQYELTPAAVKTASAAMDDEKSYVSIAGKKTYFADDMVVVFIGETGKDLAVTVKEGVQDKIVGDNYVLNADGEVAIVYVETAYDADSVDVIFLADVTADASVENLKGVTTNAYVAYLNGAEIEIMVKNEAAVVANGAGFYTFKVDAKTGEYTLTSKTGYVKVDVVEGIITQNKYVTVAGVCDDAVIDGSIYDLTDEGLATLKAINNWDGDKGAEISFLYDTKNEVITALYVTLEA